MKIGLDLAGVAEEVTEEVVVRIVRLRLEGESEAGVGVFAHGFFSAVA